MTEPLTPERKQGIRERIEKATPGPWQGGIAGLCNLVSFDGDDISGIGIIHNSRNLDFIAHARTDISDLLESHEALLRAAKAKLADCRENGDCSDAALIEREYCSDECSALALAVAKAEGRLAG